eukprot:362930-Chlamydomonas_euryale.AAC.1
MRRRLAGSNWGHNQCRQFEPSRAFQACFNTCRKFGTRAPPPPPAATLLARPSTMPTAERMCMRSTPAHACMQMEVLSACPECPGDFEGFVYFDHQDARQAATDGTLSLSFGAFDRE